jgi:hypothetical protein
MMGHYELEKSKMGSTIERALGFGFNRYSVTKVGGDINSHIVDDYLDSLENVMKNEGLNFEGYKFLQPHKSNGLTIVSSKVYIIGEDEKLNNPLMRLINACPQGPILEDIQKKLSKNPGYFLNKQIDAFLEKAKKQKRKVLAILEGPEYYFKDELVKIKRLFISDNSRFVHPFS